MITTTATITSSTTQMTSISNFTEFSSSKTSHIWDSDFWKCNTTHTPVMAKSSSSSSSSVIQKGRFKIIIGQDDYSCEPVRQHVVFEWKRKRSNSSAISLSTKKK
ncbi:uncharacterized protein BX663DRAFT_437658 [Cokeromyces recurvatus]|uniref:uncharacterized protein n=1 Tax=Cokeromyces recurvatus TaxID=90255 RepID=UPI00221E6F60|nr:uncharacterized protein BX663DRAFT_437658 [Cokeromyces recurvatus]KAI7901481.1 hypothetical protein BX663DRAFT_437658 [Cokeromyces recurvatus]